MSGAYRVIFRHNLKREQRRYSLREKVTVGPGEVDSPLLESRDRSAHPRIKFQIGSFGPYTLVGKGVMNQTLERRQVVT